MTEFIGISFGLDYFGVRHAVGIPLAVVLVVVAAALGNFRRFERSCPILCASSLAVVPVLVAADPAPGVVLLVICGIVGTTIAPWHLFFQQSYVIDKRITTRFVAYERWNPIVGIFVVIRCTAASARRRCFMRHSAAQSCLRHCSSWYPDCRWGR